MDLKYDKNKNDGFGTIVKDGGRWIINNPFKAERKIKTKLNFDKIEIEKVVAPVGRSTSVDYVCTIDDKAFSLSLKKVKDILKIIHE